MSPNLYLKAGVLSVCLMGMSWVHAANLSSAQYKAENDRISAAYKADNAACDKFSGNAEDICEEEAQAKEKVAKAELELRHTGKGSDREKLAEVKAETAYEVAKERCDDKAGNDKDVCVKQAQADKEKAMADIKLGHDTRGASKDAKEDKREADYKVAKERCDALSGDAKDSCVANAKRAHGVN